MLLLDTAGRLHVDQALMDEMKAVAGVAAPTEVLLVVDALTGQDAVNVAQSFSDEVPLTGVILTRMDGDARGGAALSMRAVTGKPIKFAGTGEKLDAIEPFHPGRVAGRILGMGDIVSIVEKAAADRSSRKTPRRMAERMLKGQFDMNDLRTQLRQMQQHGRARHARRDDAGHEEGQAGDGRERRRRPGAAAHGRDHRLDDAQGARPGPNCSTPSARSASRRARAPRCRTSTSCSRCTRKWAAR